MNFTCKKCRQYSYVKITQKTKKCLRCGRTYQVKNILSLGEIVYGVTTAVEVVKQKQTELAVPEFRSEGDFAIATNISPIRTPAKRSKRKVLSDKDKVKDVLGLGEVVYGMTAAVDTVKQKQTELATPEFRSESDFVVAANKFPTRTPVKKSKRNVLSDKDSDKNIDFKEQFIEVLLELSKLYGKFPKYMLEIMADNYRITAFELKLLIKRFKKQGILTVLKNEGFYYQVKVKLLLDLQTKD